jgi:hypothetical protein
MIRAPFLVFALALAADAAIAQTAIDLQEAAEPADASSIPRTADGRPDFTGAWVSSFITPLERMPGATSLTVSEAEAKQLGETHFQQYVARESGLDPDVLAADVRGLLRVGGEYRTSLVVEPENGKIPFTPEGRRLIDGALRNIPALPDDPEFRPESERCIASHGRTPLTLTPTVNSRQIVQTGQHVMLYTEEGQDVRIVSLGGAHRPQALAMWGGDSIARWDGEDLVIETTNQRGLVRIGAAGTMVVRPETRVVERLKFLSPDEILYGYTVADPVVYAAPWRAEYILSRSDIPAREFGCHEGNYAMVNMLSSARSVERRASAGRQPAKR